MSVFNSVYFMIWHFIKSNVICVIKRLNLTNYKEQRVLWLDNTNSYFPSYSSTTIFTYLWQESRLVYIIYIVCVCVQYLK